MKEPVRAASTATVTLATPGTTLDGVTLAVGDRVLLKNQSSGLQNGIYTWAGAATLLVRTPDADAAADFVHGFLVYAREGTANAGTYWTYSTSTTPIVLESTTLTFSPFAAGSGTVTSVAMTVPAEFSVSGSPITSNGTLAVTKATESANTVWAGPTSGGAAQPTFRTVVPADVPVFVASGASHATGAVPDPGASAGTTRFLREDATWQVPSGSSSSSTGGGGSGAFVPIMFVGPLTASQATLPFAGIPQTGFRNLRIRLLGRGTLAATNVTVGIQANSDAGSTYSYEVVADGSGGLNRLSSASATSAVLGYLPASTASAGAVGTLDIAIPGYAGTTFQKAINAVGAFEQSTSAGDQFNQNGGGFWRNTAAITTLTLLPASGSFDIGSYACLYGEMDTAGVLLTPASNLLYETTLTATAASISTGTLSQAYRDLRVTWDQARGDTAATSVQLRLQINGDTTSVYDGQVLQGSNATASADPSAGAASGFIAEISASTAPAGAGGSGTLLIPGYTSSTRKRWTAHYGYTVSDGATTSVPTAISHGQWRNASPAAVTSLLLFPASGNFASGTTVRVYGEPMSAGGAATGTGTRLRISANQSITTGTATLILWDTEDNDADNQHYTSSAALSAGTVSKVAASADIVGVSTVFTTDLSVGQVISIPGTATEKRVVIKITDNTHLTVNTPFVNSAATQTCTRINSAVVFRQPGFYTLEANIYSAALASGAVTLAYYLNSLTTAISGTAIGQRDPVFVNASAGYDLVIQRQFQQWDFVEVVWTQNAGTVNVLADERTHFSISARPTVIVAVPYVNVQDQKSSGTDGGTFTSGADQTRTLQTVESDIAGVATLASNQITLPPGTYRYRIDAPATQVGKHQVMLYNATTTTTVKRGSTAYSDSGIASPTTSSVVTGKVTITTATAFEVRHRCQTTRATFGFGAAASFGTEVYTVAEFWKEG
jgi:hypothetical protein